ncbi:MAG: mycothiol synthase [Actinobacteria bacterium]|nr:mycothiol synthase [Actinomycetota bacterium]
MEVSRRLEPGQVREVLDLVDTVAASDGVIPLSEHVILHLRHGGDEEVRHVLARSGDHRLVGYAHLDVTDLVEGPSAELAVRPEDRRAGVGRALVDELLLLGRDSDPGGSMRLWAHGEGTGAQALATSMGFERTRVLWQMRRSLLASLPPAELPPTIAVRTFLPGIDDEAWLSLNAAAFTALPDQGNWTAEDLEQRKAESWFDPTGFLLAETPDGELAGFHWTKVHGAHHHHPPGDDDHVHPHGHAHVPIGEVYVIGVSPGHRGTGLGRALLLAGLHQLRSRGLTQGMLYVDADNAAAIRLYEELGFTRWDTDVLFRR